MVSLSDRGRGLEWLSLGFGLWLIASLVVALTLGEAKASTAPELAGMIEPAPGLLLASSAAQLFAALVLGLGLVTLFRCGHRLWFGCALAALAVLLAASVAAVALPRFDLGDRTPDWTMIYGVGAGAELCLAAFVLLGIRALAGDDEDTVPVFFLGAAIGAAARAGFTGAAVLVAACLAGELYVLSVGREQRLAAAISSLGHLVAYLAFLRSAARVGERLGDDDLSRRAGALGKLAVVTVPAASISGYLLLGNPADLAPWIAVPIAVAAVAFAALLPCALLARQLATRLRQRFVAPPRAVVRAS